jgi:hypothetical protein
MGIRSSVLIGTAIGLMAVGFASTAAYAAAADNGANTYVQEQSLWCWAAVSKTVLNEAGHGTPTQCQLVKWGKGTSTCANVAGSFGANVGSALVLGGIGSAGNVANVAISYPTVQTEINADRVVLVFWAWDSDPTGIGHMIALRGYNTNGATVSYIDPRFSTFQSNLYSWVANNSTSTWTWSRYNVLA